MGSSPQNRVSVKPIMSPPGVWCTPALDGRSNMLMQEPSVRLGGGTLWICAFFLGKRGHSCTENWSTKPRDVHINYQSRCFRVTYAGALRLTRGRDIIPDPFYQGRRLEAMKPRGGQGYYQSAQCTLHLIKGVHGSSFAVELSDEGNWGPNEVAMGRANRNQFVSLCSID
ncbi:hypothetical protein B0H17DRAFT_1142302 [Mycena rosella]|uniref:Uncharacterized protein n=1 Tax=Mycena rosella TaxID=1033263 RepID=A0AAD7G948_MYCRO|nr:hypothetical protein B0H17DRAFT_1142302 [Mycena rosella]